ncbi:MAG: bifunctional phosphoribosylaminoimidazolecarboxamide formyltransferase/IMP cyclohydrolase [Planctomycetes bacterium]|nr:bifunctional phosphoribosylaminoimidazolecarboxamide formyltransferase/IMP cyclohydrolase [Planctomycetota bacterium]
MISASPFEFFVSRKVERALLSVSDKTGLVDFARILTELGVELVSTGGTRDALLKAGLTVKDVSEITNFPEMLDGRVKTLHPFVHGGLLARRDDPKHMLTLAEHGIRPIDLVVCNLYPFAKTVANPAVTLHEAIENIDIGGPTMVRAAAKNYAAVAILTDASQYAEVANELRGSQGSLALATREKLAIAAFTRIAAYDVAISEFFARRSAGEPLPPTLDLHFERKQMLRYGENPHQKAAFYVETNHRRDGVAGAEVLHGKELSYNNILDLDSALNLVREFDTPAAVVIKHNNPCGAAFAAELADAFQKAFDGDPTSAFGGILAFNRTLDEATALKLAEPNRFVECIIAPDFEPKAFEILTTKPTWRKNVRLLKIGPLTSAQAAGESLDYRRVDGGLLVQSRDGGPMSDWWPVTNRKATPEEMADLQFAWKVCKHVKSNAIVLARNGMIIGVGAGQMSRVDSVQIAIRKAGDRVRGSVLASDAFFPFRDNVDAAAAAGVKAIVQPGGSQRDADSIAACEEKGLAMLFTGMRHFRH